MSEQDARMIYERFCRETGRTPTSSSAISEPDESWRFVEAEGAGSSGIYEGVVVRANGDAFSFGGALGKVFRNYSSLGSPTSTERSLGATAFGRYQAFSTAVSPFGKVVKTLPFLFLISSPLRRQICIVAFFDLRGFTAWSKDADP